MDRLLRRSWFFSLSLFLFMLCILALWPLAPSWASGSYVDVAVDGQLIDFDVRPFVDENNRTLVPIRFVAQSLGHEVGWKKETKTVEIKNGVKYISLTIDSKRVLVNGQEKTIDSQAILRQDRTLVPLRFVSEEMGARVDYDADKRRVLLEKAPEPLPEEPEEGGEETDPGLKVIDKVQVTVSSSSVLNVRSSPRTDRDNVLGKVAAGRVFKVLDQEEGWYGVDYENKKAWISASYAKVAAYKFVKEEDKTEADGPVQEDKKDKHPTKTVKGIRVDVSYGSKLNVRDGASLGAEVLGKVTRNDRFPYLGQRGSWYQIDYANTTGYVHKDYAVLYEEEVVDLDKIEARRGRINSAVVNVRTSPQVTDNNENRISQVTFGSDYDIVDKTEDWYQILLEDGQKGWLVKRAVDLVDDFGNVITADGIEHKNLAKLFIVDVDKANIRKAPSKSAPLLSQARKKDLLPIQGLKGDWYKVGLSDGRIGYIASSLGKTRTELLYKNQVEETDRTDLARIQEIRVDADGLHLVSDEDILYRVFVLNDPARAMVSLYDVDVDDEQLGTLQVDEGRLKGLKVERYGEHRLRLELSFDKPSSIDVSSQGGDDQRHLLFSVEEAPLFGKTIVIDPGHGAYKENGRFDVGATSPSGIYEYLITNDISMDIANRLIALGAQVILTHDDQEIINMGLNQRVSLANKSGADIFVSIHSDSYPDNPSASGMATYYYHGNGNVERKIALASHILDGLCQYTGRANNGIKNRSFRVIKYTGMPSVLVEVGFLSNKVEEKLLQTSSFRSLAAEGIVEGIRSYFGR